MSMLFVANNTDLGDQRIRLGAIAGLTQMAEKGQVGFSEIPVDDPLFNLNLQAFRNFYVVEFASGAPKVIFSGFAADRSYARADSMLTGGALADNGSPTSGNCSNLAAPDSSIQMLAGRTWPCAWPSECSCARPSAASRTIRQAAAIEIFALASGFFNRSSSASPRRSSTTKNFAVPRSTNS